MSEDQGQEKLLASVEARLSEAHKNKDEKALARLKKCYGTAYPQLFSEPKQEIIPVKNPPLKRELEEILARLKKKAEEAQNRPFDLNDPEDRRIMEREDYYEKKQAQKEALHALSKVEYTPEAPSGFSLNELLSMKLPEPRFAVPGVLQEGLTLLAGKPKKGKSWLALTLAVCVSMGRTAFGKFDCDPGDVLYLAMEDKGNPGRLQRRSRMLLGKLFPGGSSPILPQEKVGDLRFELAVEGKEQFIETASDWIAKAKNPKLIIVDTLAKIMPEGEYDNNDYKQAYRFMASLQAWAISNHIAVVVIHHTNKGRQFDPIDEVMGSTGLTGAADSIWVYTKSKNKNILFLSSRDLDTEKSFVVDYEKKGYLCIEGELEKEVMSPERKRIFELLKEKPMSIKKASEILAMDYNNAKQIFWKMREEGKLDKDENGDFFAL